MERVHRTPVPPSTDLDFVSCCAGLYSALCFQSGSGFTVNSRGEQGSPVCPGPLVRAQPPDRQLHQNATLYTVADDPRATCRSHPKATASFRARSWCCACHGFGQMYDDMCPSLQYGTEQFRCPKNPLCSTHSSPLPQPLPTQTLLSPQFWLFLNFM